MPSLGARFLGDGRFGEPLRTELLDGRPIVFEEGLRGSYVLRVAGEYTMNPTRGAVAVCPDRFVVWSRRSTTVDVPLTRHWLSRLRVVADRPDRLVVTTALPGGTLSVRLRVPDAARVVALLVSDR